VARRAAEHRVLLRSRFESLILSLHSRFTCNCNKEEINDDDDDDDDDEVPGFGVRARGLLQGYTRV